MRWEVLIEILLHITSDINTDTGWGAGPAGPGISSHHQQNTRCVMNECDNMRALLATRASSLLTAQSWASPQ